MKIKFIVFALSFIFVASSCNLTKKKVNHGWITNLEEGFEFAKKEKKNVLVLFTGSDWCPPCKKLHHEVFETEEFKTFAKENLILIELDFPRRNENKLSPEQTKYNKDLSRKYKIRGFPSVIMLDKNGKEIDKWVGYHSTPLENTLNKYKEAITKHKNEMVKK